MKSIDINRALLFIDEHGNLQDKARLLFLMLGEVPPGNITRPLLEKQNPDGGFPSRPRGENISSVDSTLTALWQLNEVGALGSREAQRAIQFLADTQKADGAWDENPALPLHDLPPWIVPGQQATINYLTSYSAYWLALTNFSDQARVKKALDLLASQQKDNGEIPGYMHSQWIATGAFMLAGKYQNEVDRSLEYLQSRPPDTWENSQIAWALDCLGGAGLSQEHPLISTLLNELVHRQEDGGSWSSEDGPAYAVSATISALKAIKRFGGLKINL